MPTKSEREAIEAERPRVARKEAPPVVPPTHAEYAHLSRQERAKWVVDGKTDKFIPKPPTAPRGQGNPTIPTR